VVCQKNARFRVFWFSLSAIQAVFSSVIPASLSKRTEKEHFRDRLKNVTDGGLQARVAGLA